MNRKLTIIGIILSVLYACCIINAVSLKEINDLLPNALGDFLGGTLGPITTLWLILGFFQQNTQLRQNSEALNLQMLELQASAGRQKELLAITREQIATEIASLQEERARHNNSAKPRFVFRDKYIRIGQNGQNSAWLTHIQNIGNTATDICFHFSPEIHRCSHVNIGIWNRNDDQKFSIAFHPNGMFTLMDSASNNYEKKYQLCVSYIDALGLSGEQQFVFQLIKENDEVLLRIQANIDADTSKN
jgi:hypothetical protein